MDKQDRRVLKAVEKFRKNAAKDLNRVKALHKKSGELATQKEPSTALDRLFERLRQKELQTTGEIDWADQLLVELHAAALDRKKAKKEVAGTTDTK